MKITLFITAITFFCACAHTVCVVVPVQAGETELAGVIDKATANAKDIDHRLGLEHSPQ